MDPAKVIAVVLTYLAAAWTVATFGAPAGVVLIIGVLAGAVTAALLRR